MPATAAGGEGTVQEWRKPNAEWGTDNSTVIAVGIEENPGSVDYEPFETSPPPCAPIPELSTVLLFAVGLLMLAGYVRVGRRKT